MRHAAIAGGLAALMALLLSACNPDPTTARPPPGAPSVPYTASVSAVGPGTPHPLSSSWRPGCPVPPSGLRLVSVTHWGYDGRAHTGQLVVAADLTDEVSAVFRRLYDQRFQIARMRLVDAYGGSDAASMADNNTSAFNCRRVAGTTTWSEHSYGRALDINPVQNPYVRNGAFDPPAGSSWADRASATPGMLRDGDAVVVAFADHGFRWGGHWRTVKDYQHFSTSGR